MKFLKSIIWIILGLSILSAFAFAQTEEPHYCAKVMSYNILNTIYEPEDNPWTLRKSLIFDLIDETSPDLIAFQEDSVEQVEDLEKRFPQYEVVRAPISIASRERAHHSFFYNSLKFSLLSNGSFSEVNRARRNANWAKFIEIETGEILFAINGHFLFPAEPQVRLDAAIQYATKIALLNAENAPIIMFGDLNSNLASDPVQYLISEEGAFPDLQYPSGFRQLYSPMEWQRNFNSSILSTTATDTIDFVLTSSEFSISNPQQVNRIETFNGSALRHSDHPAVLERVCIGSPPTKLFNPTLLFILLNE